MVLLREDQIKGKKPAFSHDTMNYKVFREHVDQLIQAQVDK